MVIPSCRWFYEHPCAFEDNYQPLLWFVSLHYNHAGTLYLIMYLPMLILVMVKCEPVLFGAVNWLVVAS